MFFNKENNFLFVISSIYIFLLGNYNLLLLYLFIKRLLILDEFFIKDGKGINIEIGFKFYFYF